MRLTGSIGMCPLLWAMLAIACCASAAAQDDPVGVCVDPRGCGPEPTPAPSPTQNNPTPSYDYEAARRAQEALDAAAAAERQRQVEAERIERERVAAEKRRKDAEFIRNRDATVLKGGSIGTSVYANDGGLKGSSTVTTGLKELHGSDPVTTNAQGSQAAWKQLHCVAALSGDAFAALKQPTPDYQESSFLLKQAGRALDGQSLGVECPAAPPFPNLHGRKVDMDRVKESEKKIIGQAVVIVERMRQRADHSTVSPAPAQTANESADEKMRRVQRELNQANSVKIAGKTKAEIGQQERDRKELTKLILANSHVEKGELTGVSVDIGAEEAPKARPKDSSKVAPVRVP